MAVMLERWNDDKMDALDAKVNQLGGQMSEQRQETREIRGEMRDLRKEMVDMRKETHAALERLARTMTYGAIALSGSMIVGFAALIGLFATQL